jgi:hypothetical protein
MLHLVAEFTVGRGAGDEFADGLKGGLAGATGGDGEGAIAGMDLRSVPPPDPETPDCDYAATTLFCQLAPGELIDFDISGAHLFNPRTQLGCQRLVAITA